MKQLTMLSRTDAAGDKIVIQTIYFGSENLWLTVGLATAFRAISWTGVTGATYEDTGNHVDGRKKED